MGYNHNQLTFWFDCVLVWLVLVLFCNPPLKLSLLLPAGWAGLAAEALVKAQVYLLDGTWCFAAETAYATQGLVRCFLRQIRGFADRYCATVTGVALFGKVSVLGLFCSFFFLVFYLRLKLC